VHEFTTAGTGSGVLSEIIFSFSSQIFVNLKLTRHLGLLRFELKGLILPLFVPAVVL
jgi:hypothetical protein